mgnify:CR=1 FL=1
MPVSQVTHQGTACGPPQRLGHAALFDQGRGKGQMTCARRPSPRISAGELPGRTDRPWLSPSDTAEHRREDARRPSLGGSRWPSEDVSRQLDLPKKDGTVHNTVLSHWTNSKKLFLINGLGAAFCFHRPLQTFPIACFAAPARLAVLAARALANGAADCARPAAGIHAAPVSQPEFPLEFPPAGRGLCLHERW